MYENGKNEIVKLSRLLPIEVIMERFKQGTSAVNWLTSGNLITQYGLRLLVLGLGLELVLYYTIWILLICAIYPDIRRVYPTNGSHVFQPEPPISTYILTVVMGSIPHSQGIVPFKWSMSVRWDVILYSLQVHAPHQITEHSWRHSVIWLAAWTWCTSQKATYVDFTVCYPPSSVYKWPLSFWGASSMWFMFVDMIVWCTSAVDVHIVWVALSVWDCTTEWASPLLYL